MLRVLTALLVLAAIGAGVLLWLSRPVTAPATAVAGIAPDVERGRQVFHAGGCASCHAAPETEGEDRLVLSGGRAFASPFGTFYAPNISTDPQHGIGDWSAPDLLTAMRHGVSPEGRHYYPAFPYTAYVNASAEDVVALHAYLQTLPASGTPSRPHDVGFPFNIRRSLGLWKRLYLRAGWTVEGDLSETEARGRYLAEALGHCGECHTPRDALGGLKRWQWMAGAPNPTGDGRIPNVTPAELTWSANDIAAYLQSGFTPEFDTAGGHMAAVIENTAALSDADRAALAAYLKAVPPVE